MAIMCNIILLKMFKVEMFLVANFSYANIYVNECSQTLFFAFKHHSNFVHSKNGNYISLFFHFYKEKNRDENIALNYSVCHWD